MKVFGKTAIFIGVFVPLFFCGEELAGKEAVLEAVRRGPCLTRFRGWTCGFPCVLSVGFKRLLLDSRWSGSGVDEPSRACSLLTALLSFS